MDKQSATGILFFRKLCLIPFAPGSSAGQALSLSKGMVVNLMILQYY